jgi:sporulation protein YlmC with PRC-barrel domain
MILNDLLRNDVLDPAGDRIGRVIDVRLQLEGVQDPSVARVVGLVVSPRSAASFMGYERGDLNRPVLLAGLLQWMHRGSFLVPWADVLRIDSREVRLRPGYRRESAAAPG